MSGLGTDYTGDPSAPALTSGAWLLPNTLVVAEVRPNVVTVEGADGTTATAVAAEQAVGLGRIGEYVTYSYVLSADTLQDIADARLARNIQTVAASVEVAAGAHWRPWADYYVGDIIWVDIGQSMPAGWYRVERISGRLTNEASGFRYIVDVGRAVVAEDAAVADKLAAILEAGLIDLDTGLVTAGATGQATTTVIVTTSDIPAHTHSVGDLTDFPQLGGDVVGTVGSATVERIQGREFASTAPAEGDNYVWNDDNRIAEWRARATYDTFAARSALTAADLRDGDLWVDTDDDSLHVWDAGGAAWIDPTAAGGSPLTTKGDLYGYSSADTRVPVGVDGQILTADTSAATGVSWQYAPSSAQAYTYQFPLDGTLATGTGVFRIPIFKTQQIVGLRLAVDTAPTGADLIVDVNIDGATAYTTQANRPTVPAGANDSGTVTLPNTTLMNAGSYLTVDIDQVGSTVAGADATLVVVCEEALGTVVAQVQTVDRQWSSVTSASTTLTATLPTTRLPGDLLVVFLATDDNETFTTPTGWTEIVDTTRNNSTCFVMAREADGTESSTVDVTIGTAALATIHAWTIRGWFNTGNILDAFDSVGTQTSGFNINPPAVTPRWALAESLFIGGGSDRFARTVSATPTADYADWELSDLNQSTGAPLAAIAESTETVTSKDFGSFTHSNDTDVSSFALAVRETPPGDLPSFVGVDGNVGTQGSSATLNIDVPAGVADGDLMVMFATCRGGSLDYSEMAGTRGWTNVFNLSPTDTSGVTSGGTTDRVVQCWAKTASSEGATTPVDWLYSFGSGGYNIHIAAYRNAEIVDTDWLDPSVSDTIAPALTAAVDDMLVCWFFTEFAQFNNFSTTPASGMVNFVYSDTDAVNYYSGHVISQQRITSAGSTGTKEITGVNNFCGATSILLRTP